MRCRLRRTHPGPVVHISDNQNDPNKVRCSSHCLSFCSGHQAYSHVVHLIVCRSVTVARRIATDEEMGKYAPVRVGKVFVHTPSIFNY